MSAAVSGERFNVFDTSALIDFFPGCHRAKLIELHLPQDALHIYHPISLAEIGRRTHSDFWPNNRHGRRALEQRQKMLQLLKIQANRTNQKWWLRGRWRFTPFEVTWSHFEFLLRQTRNPQYLCQIGGEVHVVCALTDHQIVSVASRLREKGKDVIFASGDRAQIEAAAMLGVPWLYTRDPSFAATKGRPFPWGERKLTPLHPM